MSEARKDTDRALAAARAIFDGRDPREKMADIMVTLDGLVALVLLTVMEGNERKAVGMLYEGLLPGVEERIALHANRSTVG